MSVLTRRAVMTGLAACAVQPVFAQSPQPPIRIVFPYPAGGSADTIVRMVAEQFSLGRAVIVENRTGAGGRIGAQAVRDAPADGATLLFAAATQFTLQTHVLKELGYDPFSDFVPICRI